MSRIELNGSLKIPESWCFSSLSKVAEIYSGVWGKALEARDNKATQEVRVFRVSDVKDDYSLAYDKAPLRNVSESQSLRYRLSDGDLVVVKSSGSSSRIISGRCALFNQPSGGEVFIPSNFTFGLKRKPTKIDAQFLYFWLRSHWVKTFIEGLAEGSTYPNLKKSEFQHLPVVLPSLSEQHRISAVLSLVQQAIEEQKQLVELTTELKKALMHKLFTEGTRGEPQKQTEIGPIPESWEVVELQTAGDVVYGIQASVANNLEPIGTRILTNKNIILDGGFSLDKINYFELRTKRHYQTILKVGDLLFNWRSGSKEHVGKTAYFDLDGEYTHSSFILRIRPNDSVNGRFLYHFFNWLREAGYFVKLQTYAVNAKFNKSAVNVLPTAKPSREEQNDIAATIDTVIDLENVAKHRRDTMTSLFCTLLHKLMTAEIRMNDLDLEELGIKADKEQAEAV